MNWFSKLQKDTKILLIVVSLAILISGLRIIYANLNSEKRLEALQEKSLNFVSLDEFRTFINEKEVSDLNYDIEKDIFTAILKEEAKVKYGITGNGIVALGNISRLMENNQITNEVILETIRMKI